MTAAWLLLLLAVILLVVGFAVKVLFWIAAVVFVIWLIGWLVGAAGSDRRWYYWS